MEDQAGGAPSALRIFSTLVPRIRATRLMEYLIVIGILALGAQTSLRVFNKAMSKKEQTVTVSSTDSDCVGGLCTVQVVEEGAPPKAP